MLFATPTPDDQELAVVDRIEDLRRRLRFSVAERRRWTGLVRRVLFARNIRGSNSIEGYEVTLEDALALAEDEEPLDAEQETAAAVLGYRNAMTYVLQLANDPQFSHSEALIKSLHFMMTNYEMDKSPGLWRQGPVFVRDDDTGQIVYEGAPSEAVPELAAELVVSLNEIDRSPALVRAAMAHLNLVMIHPFRDGNGRMARALQTLILAREGILVPEFASIEEYLGRNTPAYYRILAEVGGGRWQPERDTRPWVRFCLTAHYRQAATILQRVNDAERTWGYLDGLTRERRLSERAKIALYYAVIGLKVRNSLYRTDAEISEQLATKDLIGLVELGLLVPEGERRGRYYTAGAELKKIRADIDAGRKPIEDPFDT